MAQELKTYRGNCHCAAFVFEIKAPEIKEYYSCKCSICHKKAYAWVDQHGDVTFVKGSADGLTSYDFNEGKYLHQFCPTCGTPVMGTSKGGSSRVNGRTLQDLNLWSLEAKFFDGKALPPPYKAPVYRGPEPTAKIEGGKIYHGSCHCGDVTLAVKVEKPFEEWPQAPEAENFVDCNCSLCARIGYVWVYPEREQSNILGREKCTSYVFNRHISKKLFCKRCGVHICNDRNDKLTDDEISKLNEEERDTHSRHSVNINLRVLNDFDCDNLKCSRLDGLSDIEGEYINP